ncbi:hypothetical protein [Micromonospora aurantiaca (nom. illeg.)]|uniref:hypothetical protein n=1 Tax=Micromonospora aurantiaca (nom. illeg.) TaxID=47850 RepID=UPI0035AD7D2F
MTLHQIRIYHNTESRLTPYEDGHRLTATVSLGRDLPAGIVPEQIGEWAFHVFNVDLDQLERERLAPEWEISFLIGCVYRLLRLRSLSVGDVIELATDRESWWPACDPFRWRRITPPSNVHGQLLTAEKVDQHIAAQTSHR